MIKFLYFFIVGVLVGFGLGVLYTQHFDKTFYHRICDQQTKILKDYNETCLKWERLYAHRDSEARDAAHMYDSLYMAIEQHLDEHRESRHMLKGFPIYWWQRY